MKIETELKYQIDNFTMIKKKLSNLGFSFIKKSLQEDYYFSPPHKTFAGTRKYYLRLRRENHKAIFAYHIVYNNLQTKEWEIQVNNFSALLKILILLDFKIDCKVKKERLTYKKQGIKIMLDKVKNLGNFIEIEYNGKFTRKVKKQLTNLTNILQLKKEKLVSGLGYPDLFMQKL